MNQLLLIVSVAGGRVAFPAAKVESVVELDALSPVPRAPAHVAGLSALRSRVLTVIDCVAAAWEESPPLAAACPLAMSAHTQIANTTQYTRRITSTFLP